MADKRKFQLSRNLDLKLKRIAENVIEFEPDFETISFAYILGFHCANTTNFIGLTRNLELHHSFYPVIGLAFFKSNPNEEELQTKLQPVIEHTTSDEGFGTFKSDKNQHLFLICTFDSETKQLVKRIFDSSCGTFLQDQPKLSVLDDTKIFNHSILLKLNFNIKLKILESSNKLDKKERIEDVITSAKKLISNESKQIKIHVLKSSFSTSAINGNKNASETLYDYLDPPSDILQMEDYLSNLLSKDEKQKKITKWRNKMKSQRSPLEMELEHDGLSFDGNTNLLSSEFYGFRLELFLHIHANDPISKSLNTVLYSFRRQLDMLKIVLIDHDLDIEQNELKSCSFNPQTCNFLISAIYSIPEKVCPNFKNLENIRRQLHRNYLIPMNQPQFRYSQRIKNLSLKTSDEEAGYLCNVHVGILDNSGIKGGARAVIKGTYTYHHYMQNRANDNGWGCAYRSLQTIISWFKHQGYIYSPDVKLREPKSNDKNDKSSELRRRLHLESRVPTHEEIQTVLVHVGDKESSFIGSQKWIGSQEVCYVLNHLYNLDSKFISVSSGGELPSKVRELSQHLDVQSTPVMIGGGVLAHTIIGVDFNEKNGDVSYLILDPHYTGIEDESTITKKGWCGWKKNSFWDKNAFYNMCLPQRPSEF